MSRVLIIAEHSNGKLNPATSKCVSCATAIGAVRMKRKNSAIR